MTRNAATLSAAISRIYDAALDPDGWPDALRDCCAYLDGAALQLYAIDADSRACLFQIGYGLSAQYLTEYQAFFSQRSNRNEFHLSRPSVDVGYDYLMMDERALDRDACSQWRAKFGFRYYVGGPLMRSDEALFFAALQRGPTQGHAQGADIEAFRALRGHLAQALRIRQRLGSLDLHHRGAWEAVERGAMGVVVLDSKGRILECNGRARHVLALADGLVADQRELRAVRPIDDRALKRLIGSAFGDAGGGNLALARRGRERPYSLIVSPVERQSGFDLPAEGRVLVLINDPDSQQDIPEDLLRSHYGLTRKQIALAVLLTRGLTISACAAELEIADKTARRHLATIFARTGVHRQADLVRLVLSLPGLRH